MYCAFGCWHMLPTDHWCFYHKVIIKLKYFTAREISLTAGCGLPHDLAPFKLVITDLNKEKLKSGNEASKSSSCRTDVIRHADKREANIFKM